MNSALRPGRGLAARFTKSVIGQTNGQTSGDFHGHL